jgi:DNA polymerase-3 subunit alpha
VIAAGLAPEFTADLAALLTPYKGVNGSGCPVSINYASELATAEILLGDEWKVTPEDELIQTLRERFGATHVNLRY